MDFFHTAATWLYVKYFLYFLGFVVVCLIGVYVYFLFDGLYDFSGGKETFENEVFVEKVVEKKQVKTYILSVLRLGTGLYLQGLLMEILPTSKKDSYILSVSHRGKDYELFARKEIFEPDLLKGLLEGNFPKDLLLFEVKPWATIFSGKVLINYSCSEFGRKE